MPLINKRDLFRTAGGMLAGAGLAACGGGQAAPSSKAAFVLVHGAWHGAWSYERVIPELAARGHMAVARDLPAHGLNARTPESYAVRPITCTFSTEASPVASVSLDDYVNSTLSVIDQVRAAGYDKVVLVGHSMGGIVLNKVGELASGKISKLVYLAANMPRTDVPIGLYFGEPEGLAAQVNPVLIGDAFATGAFRLDPRNSDSGYRSLLKAAFYNDTTDVDFNAAADLLTPDMPTGPMVTPITLTRLAWGSLPRHYIMCLRDNAVPQALARRFIKEADEFTPSNPTVVHSLNTSHSPFVSTPVELATLLAAIANS